ncbi:MAG: malate synthase A, partial [Actinomycetota bacterium]|nr:malate synthase A [Actinomycetota bacterium]
MSERVQAVQINGPRGERFDEILTADALEFVARLHRAFDLTRRELLAARMERQKELDVGGTLDFLPDTKDVREGDWKVAPEPDALQNRRVEITGPTSRKMVINALNSGASGFMADFEDSNSPTWRNMIGGQVN